eukprot:jgi/Orpsp1_1/1177342/evm.model.c7180000061059.1
MNENFRKVVGQVGIFGFGGERITNEFLQIVLKFTKGKIYVALGLTEVTSMCTLNCCKNDDIINNNKFVTIGKPNCNYKIYILDNNMKPVPVGVEGEIFIGGYSVSKGYLKSDKLTKERFIECPFKTKLKENRLFRTGDL